MREIPGKLLLYIAESLLFVIWLPQLNIPYGAAPSLCGTLCLLVRDSNVLVCSISKNMLWWTAEYSRWWDDPRWGRYLRRNYTVLEGNETWVNFCLEDGDERGLVESGRGWGTSHLDLNFVASWGGIQNTAARVGRGKIRHLFMGHRCITQRRNSVCWTLPIRDSIRTISVSWFSDNLIIWFYTYGFKYLIYVYSIQYIWPLSDQADLYVNIPFLPRSKQSQL